LRTVDKTPRKYKKLSGDEKVKLKNEFLHLDNITEQHIKQVASELNLSSEKIYKWVWDKKNHHYKN